ncbi:MAG TPA: tetratricopeptide repeat protein [Polyangia bacterium]|nr:tetratricopeptide repeat protein [Polyangia bacterium]
MFKPSFHHLVFALVAGLYLAGAGSGCSTGGAVPADVRVPPDLLRGSPYTAGGEVGRTRYVVRMTDGQRDWEIQLPEYGTAYQVTVPLSGKPSGLVPDMAEATEADREIIAENQAEQRARADSAPGPDDAIDESTDKPRPGLTQAGGKGARPGPTKPAAGTPEPAKASYLLTLAKVKDLYRTRHYELGLVEIVKLEQQYPDDEHILSMKGSLYERLGNKNLAREAWQEALRLNPFNLAVLEALQRLGK